MALLQLAEPGLSTAPHQHRLAIGIDLGTTNSLAASVIGGLPTVLPDAQGRLLLPSVVRYTGPTPDCVVVGHDAQAQQAKDPRNTIASVKRLMGRALEDLTARTPYAYVDGPGMVSVMTAAGVKSPVDVSAAILQTLRLRAEAALGGVLVGAVVTVPAYFDDAQRQATKDAARLAGIEVLRLLNEPTAAAIAYGLDRAAEGLFAVYDLGGGTFDVSVLRLSRGVFEVLATGGDSSLGGDDFDHAIVQWLVGDSASALAPGDLRQLLMAARTAKEALSDASSVRIRVSLWTSVTEIDRILSRDTFDQLTAALVNRAMRATRKTLRDAGVTVDDVDGVVLVGGSTRMPAIRRAVEILFGKAPLIDLDPDQVVALGAAIQADVLAGNRRDDQWMLLDVCPLSLGLETMGGLTEKIVPRNSTLPLARAQDFTTFRDGQTAMEIHVVQGERELVAECRSLARFTLRGIPPMVAGAARIRVTFQVDADGLLSVTARETVSGVDAHIEVRPSFGLDDATIASMLAEANRAAGADAQARTLREAQVDARRLLDATEAALAADGSDLLAPPERAHIDAAIYRVADLLGQGDDAALAPLRAAASALNHATMEFAARRMNAGIGRALKGVRLDALT